jgi:capsular polysaccharide transport system permease protein
VPPPVPASSLRPRHWALILSFLAVVALPVAVSGWYLWARAADQYASYVGFSVRKEEAGSPLDLIGGLAAISGSSSADTDILYEYMQSPGLVADIDAELDLRAIWSKAPGDPVFAYAAPGTIEDLVDH